jgi:predicted RNase H-like nuclease
MEVVGVDGCKGGWVSAKYDSEERQFVSKTHPTFVEVLDSFPRVSCVAVDMPIGLIECNWRQCDLDARRILGPNKSSCVFQAPDPRILDAPTYREATDRAFALCGKRPSVQAYGIHFKIREVNGAMTPSLQKRVIEVHPEVSFCALAGSTVISTKENPKGTLNAPIY